jgi:glycosyltransferase involved in cell wall biosynthesis
LRKNQLASILAMRNLDIPLVFIATESFYPSYEQLCLQAIQKFRRAPTWVISQNLENTQKGSLRVFSMPNHCKLPFDMLISAYQNAGLHLHPAFCELPGLTYLEAAKLGVPTIASEWTTINDYFTDPVTGVETLDDRIIYATPHHINALTHLIEKHFGKKTDKSLRHPMFQRTKADVAKDFMAVLEKEPGMTFPAP